MSWVIKSHLGLFTVHADEFVGQQIEPTKILSVDLLADYRPTLLPTKIFVGMICRPTFWIRRQIRPIDRTDETFFVGPTCLADVRQCEQYTEKLVFLAQL